jgi:UDPglucose 6-dehydrogenase
MNIAVVGTGYVGMANTMLLAQHNTVIDLDIDTERVAMINRSEPTVDDAEMSAFFASKALDIRATSASEEAYRGADFVIVATPTDYDLKTDFFDTSSVEARYRQYTV